MLMELTPSVEVTGGPWFTDQELDVDFVEQLTNQCYKYILMKVRHLLLRVEIKLLLPIPSFSCISNAILLPFVT